MEDLDVAMGGPLEPHLHHIMNRTRHDTDLSVLEDRLGYRFGDRSLLVRALTHASATPTSVGDSYQRLEFLGDRVLGLIAATLLFKACPEADEGELAQRFNQLVKRETCAAIALELGLDRALRIGPSEAQGGGRKKSAILGDVTEAVFAAVYLDGGMDAACTLVSRLLGPRLMAATGRLRDAKTTLQEWVQARGGPTPVYEAIDRSGPDHAPVFVVRVSVEGEAPADGTGKSKREAEQAAATAVLVRLGVWKEEGTR